MYIVQRQILKVVDNWSIISTALATLIIIFPPGEAAGLAHGQLAGDPLGNLAGARATA